jgi:DNA-binding MarR family transcriptional regulator
MEALGYVGRERMFHDQRRQSVSLTPAGRALFRRMWPDIDATYRQVEKELGKELTSDLYRTLGALLQRVSPPDMEPEE